MKINETRMMYRSNNYSVLYVNLRRNLRGERKISIITQGIKCRDGFSKWQKKRFKKESS